MKIFEDPCKIFTRAGFVVVYIHGFTEPKKKILTGHNVKVAQKPSQTLEHIFSKPKDHERRKQWTNSVYSIPCKTANTFQISPRALS